MHAQGQRPTKATQTYEKPLRTHLLELLHVEELHGALRLEGAVGQLEDVVGDGVVLAAAAAAGGDLDVDVGLGDALDQDVAVLVHLDLAALRVERGGGGTSVCHLIR